MVEIVSVDSSTVDQLLPLIDAFAQEEKLDAPDNEAKHRLKEHLAGEQPRCYAVLAIDDGKPVGYLFYFFTYSSFVAKEILYIEDFYVTPNKRSGGIGKQLFEHAKELAKQHDCCRVEWHTEIANERAQKFYNNQGAKKLNQYFYRLENDKL